MKLLTEAQEPDAARIADFLTKENERRRVTEREMFRQATDMVAEAGYGQDECRAIVLGRTGWHAGVVGVV
ncbi:MAG: single-stranded-DNA-specific exonuclease RecJ, partial [Candidatus Latescibacteria bacterium]|nr:single-stranded-DNA-specific exonuclease RecJ [Candidatus Latescibacterota bacterium]